MSSVKNIWGIAVILAIILFVAFVYPRIETLLPVSEAFLLIFKTLIFIAVVSFTFFLLIELRSSGDENRTEVSIPPAISESRTDDEPKRLPSMRFQVDPSQNFDTLTEQILTLVHSSLMAQTVCIYLFNPQENRYSYQNHKSSIDTPLVEDFVADGGLFENVRRSAAKIFNSDAIDSAELPYYQDPPKIGTLMLIPVYISQNQYIGLLAIDSVDQQAWGTEDLELAQSFAALFATAIWQIDALDRQKSHIQFFRNLCRTNTELSLGIDHLDLYKAVVSLSRKYFTFDKLILAFIQNDDSQELRIEYVEGYEADYSIGNTIDYEGGLWKRLIRDGQMVNLCDYENEKLEYRLQPGDLESSPFSSGIGVPFEVGAKRFGGLLIESFDANLYCQEDVETLELFGKNLSAIINRINIYKSMKDLAMIDGLTGIANHRSFKDRMPVEIDRSRRYGTPLTLLILDLDKFKRINDTYGHLFGDFLLRKTANIIRGSVRTVDTVCRYGGEEFAVILINAEKRASFNTADRIRKNIQSFVFQKDDISERITISIGMAEFPADGEDMQTIIANADMAMYQSKREGGNKVILYEPEIES